ncbi:NADH-quinone oxidoreductase subunit NuoK [Photobacterium alginatilyticum]|uniref:NADH-quinone oxidoreductase subunit NuoK n=1 Tax=Photobacterium alginatilyticum TaxID=1775171 RepID=UPI0023DA9FA1|nr:NADH-quinone oxidoreductase subunit NuoK [Photobacterium alginatilyticum]
MMVPLSWYLSLSALLFVIGLCGVLLRRNILIILMSLELMLNAVILNFVAFSFYLQDLRGQIMAIFIIAITAAEVAVALAIVIALTRNRATLRADDINSMKG